MNDVLFLKIRPKSRAIKNVPETGTEIILSLLHSLNTNKKNITLN